MAEPRAKRFVLPAALLLVLLVALALWWSSRRAAPPAGPPQLPPATVAMAPAEADRWNVQLAAVGTLDAERGVDVTSARAGVVSDIRFESGNRVRAGDVLALLDDAADRAQLATLTVQLQQAESNLARGRKLLAPGAIAAADVEQAGTQVRSLKAQVAQARELLEDKRIVAPFDGEIGIRRIDLGAYLQPGQPVVTLQQIAPILVNFALPERHYGQLQRGQPIELRVDAWPDKRFAGTVSAINPQVETATRNFEVQGRLPNEERLLRPGMFANLTITLPDARDVITVPVTAITYSPGGDSVFVVQAPKSAASAAPNAASAPPRTVTRVPVRTGERRGPAVAVHEGLRPGDVVVTAGQLKLFEGAPVVAAGASAPRTAAR